MQVSSDTDKDEMRLVIKHPKSELSFIGDFSEGPEGTLDKITWLHGEVWTVEGQVSPSTQSIPTKDKDATVITQHAGFATRSAHGSAGEKRKNQGKKKDAAQVRRPSVSINTCCPSSNEVDYASHLTPNSKVSHCSSYLSI